MCVLFLGGGGNAVSVSSYLRGHLLLDVHAALESHLSTGCDRARRALSCKECTEILIVLVDDSAEVCSLQTKSGGFNDGFGQDTSANGAKFLPDAGRGGSPSKTFHLKQLGLRSSWSLTKRVVPLGSGRGDKGDKSNGSGNESHGGGECCWMAKVKKYTKMKIEKYKKKKKKDGARMCV